MRMNREGRLRIAGEWIRAYSGKSIVKGYARWFGVDWLCALDELKLLKYPISAEAEGKIRKGHDERVNFKRKAKQKRKAVRHPMVSLDDENWPEFEFIAGYTSAGFPFGIRFEDSHTPRITYIQNIDEIEDLPPKKNVNGDVEDLPF